MTGEDNEEYPCVTSLHVNGKSCYPYTEKTKYAERCVLSARHTHLVTLHSNNRRTTRIQTLEHWQTMGLLKKGNGASKIAQRVEIKGHCS